MRHYIILFALLCASCSSALPSLKPYRMDIQQGNVVTSKMMMQLRPGMTKSQVRFIMGTPLVQDSFHSNRWDYFYQMRQQGKIIEQRRVILEFENEALARVRGDVIPAGSGQQDLATPATTPESLSKTQSKKDEKGLVDKLKFWKSDDKKTDEKKVEEQPTEAASQPGETPEAVVPVVVEPQSADAPAAATPQKVEAGQQLPSGTEAAPTPESVTVKPVDSEPIAAPVEIPAEETPAAPAPAPAPATLPESMPTVGDEAAGDEMMLRMDRSINLPLQDADPGNVSNPSQAPDADLPSEASPDFFERMLEKIGF